MLLRPHSGGVKALPYGNEWQLHQEALCHGQEQPGPAWGQSAMGMAAGSGGELRLRVGREGRIKDDARASGRLSPTGGLPAPKPT